jgi:predicted nucleic acid-binding protein
MVDEPEDRRLPVTVRTARVPLWTQVLPPPPCHSADQRITRRLSLRASWHSRKRLELPVPFPKWLRAAAEPQVVTVLPLDVDVLLALDALPGTFHGDPADRLIVATARAHALPLATRDSRIRRSRLVSLWKPSPR